MGLPFLRGGRAVNFGFIANGGHAHLDEAESKATFSVVSRQKGSGAGLDLEWAETEDRLSFAIQ